MELTEAEQEHPYSQILHVLSAVGAHKYKTEDANQKLNTAAVYSTDRKVLKEVILASDDVTTKDTAEAKERKSRLAIDKAPDTTKPQTEKSADEIVVDQPSGYPGRLSAVQAEQLREDIMINLKKLLEIKQDFLGQDQPAPKKIPKKTVAKTQAESKTKTKASSKVSTNIRSKQPPKLTVTKSSKSASKKKTPRPTGQSPQKDKKEKIISQKKLEQQELIEKFIKADPKIKRNSSKKKKEKQDDLSVPSVEFGDDLVSENLAKVLIKQGKKDKAIDIYKKLIWKYPQKKAYFASQIDSLK